MVWCKKVEKVKGVHSEYDILSDCHCPLPQIVSAAQPRQSSPKVERTLVRICMDKEGAFRFEAWSMDFNKKGGVFEKESPWIFKKRGYSHNVLSMIVNLRLNHVILVGGKSWTSL